MTTAVKLTDLCSSEVLNSHLRDIEYAFRNHGKKTRNLTVADLYSRYKAFVSTPGNEPDPRIVTAMRQVEVFLTEVLPTLNTCMVVSVLDVAVPIVNVGTFKSIAIKSKSGTKAVVKAPSLRSATDTSDKSFEIRVAEKYLQLLQSAQRRHLDFNLSLVDVRNLLLRKTCYYSNVKFNPNGGHEDSRTIDRLDCNKGYVKGNVVACTYKMNIFKENAFEHKEVDLKSIQKMLNVLIRAATGA